MDALKWLERNIRNLERVADRKMAEAEAKVFLIEIRLAVHEAKLKGQEPNG